MSASAFNAAISNRDGVGKMAVDNHNSGCSHLVEGADEGTIDVQLISGERLFELSGLDRVDLIKIDVEGFEEPVIAALAEMIRSQRPRAVLFEHHGDLNRVDAPIRVILEGCGYRLLGLRKTLFGNQLIPLEKRPEQAHDYVAIPL